jgi:hypothetical protein
MENKKSNSQFQIRIIVNSDLDVTDIAHKTAVSQKTVSTIFCFPFSVFNQILHMIIQVIYKNLVKMLFLKSFCEHLGGVR